MSGYRHFSRRDTLGLIALSLAAAANPAALAASSNAAAQAGLRRINLAGKQQMLSQQMTRAALYAALDIEAKRHFLMLSQSRNLFERNHAGLRDGNADLGLAAETDAAVVKALTSVETAWAPFAATVDAIVAREAVSDADIGRLAKVDTLLLFTAANLTRQLVAGHSRSDGASDLVNVINIAARQLMLCEKIAKEAALIALGMDIAATQKSLGESADLFENSLAALIDGLPEAGLAPPPAHIREKLLEVRGIWSGYSHVVRGIAASGYASSFDLVAIASQADPMLLTMDNAVRLYETA